MAACLPSLELQIGRRAACVRQGARSGPGLAGLDRWCRPLDARLALVPVADGSPAGLAPGAPPLPVLLAQAWTGRPPPLLRRRAGPLLRIGSRRHRAPIALLAGPEALGLGGHAVLPLRHHRLLAAPLDDPAALAALCPAAEHAREAPDHVGLEPLVPAPGSPGAWPWTGWAPAPGSPLSRRRARLRTLQDFDDYNVQHDVLERHDQHLGHIRHWSRLRVLRRAGGLATAARWLPFETVLPAADLLHIVLDGDEVWEVWTDAVLDILTAESQPLAHHWPPRFATRGGFPKTAHARLRSAGQLVDWTRAAPVEVEEDGPAR